MELFFFRVDADARWIMERGMLGKLSGRFEKDCIHAWQAYWTDILGGHEWQSYKKGSTTAPGGTEAPDPQNKHNARPIKTPHPRTPPASISRSQASP